MRYLALTLAGVLCMAGQTSKPRIAVAGISHESNSFNPAKTVLADFGWRRGVSREAFLT